MNKGIFAKFFISILIALWTVNGFAKSFSLTLYGDSRLVDAKYGNFVQAKMENVSLDQLGDLSLKTSDNIDVLEFGKEQVREVILFVPKGINPESEKAYVAAVQEQLNRRFHHVRFQIKESYIPTIQADSSAQPEVKSMVDRLAMWGRRTKDYARRIRSRVYRPKDIDMTVGTVVGGMKSIGGVGYWIAATGFNFYGLTQGLMSIGLDQIFHRYPTAINDWKMNHEIPLWRRNRIVKWYNSSPFVKAMTMNQLIVFVSQASFRLLSYLANPTTVQSPFSMGFVGTFFGMGAVGTPLGTSGDVAVMTLLKKGYISRRVAHYIYNLFGLEMQINGLLFGSGRTKWLPLGLAVEWGSKTLIWAVAKMLPPKNPRLLILHPDISKADREQIEYVHELQATQLNGGIVKNNTFADLINRLGAKTDSRNDKSIPACEAILQ